MLVLVTRPRDQSVDTVESLRRLGHEALVDSIADDTALHGWTGRSGGDRCRRRDQRQRRECPGGDPFGPAGLRGGECHGGRHSVEIRPCRTDRTRRWRRPRRSDHRGSSRPKDHPLRVLHLCGQAVAFDLEANLSAAGVTYRPRVVYELVKASSFDPATVAALRDRVLGAVLLYSPRSAATFSELVRASDLERTLDSVDAVCLSENVAAPVSHLRWRRLSVAATRDQTALLRCLAPALAPMVPPQLDGGA